MQDVEHATFDTVFTDNSDDDSAVTAEEKAPLDEYLEHFAVPANHCAKCGKKLIGSMVDQLIGSSTFEWGLVHGEGRCKGCGWPARAYHFPKGTILERFECALSLHPDYVTEKANANR